MAYVSQLKVLVSICCMPDMDPSNTYCLDIRDELIYMVMREVWDKGKALKYKLVSTTKEIKYWLYDPYGIG